jgi:RNA 3'-terminal phosphate cyclase (ATP)
MQSRSQAECVVLDGAYGEGGGQILRTALSLSAITGRPLRIERIRALRRKPGLAAQHLTAVRSAAALCAARVDGDELGSTALSFAPSEPPAAGDYVFDVALARAGGSAGAVTLVLQTVLPPLVHARKPSRVVVRGGTHVPWSPTFDYARDVWLPLLRRFGVRASLELQAWGWWPLGKGEVVAEIRPGAGPLMPVTLLERGSLRRVRGRAVGARLPAHIPHRMAERARALLVDLNVPVEIQPMEVQAACAGAGLFLTSDYAEISSGFSALGERGRTSEQVAEAAVAALLAHHRSGAALDRHLGDQALLPMSLAGGVSAVSVEEITPHLQTNAWVIERFGVARVVIEPAHAGGGRVTVTPS